MAQRAVQSLLHLFLIHCLFLCKFNKLVPYEIQLSMSWSGAEGGLSPSRSSLVLLFPCCLPVDKEPGILLTPL